MDLKCSSHDGGDEVTEPMIEHLPAPNAVEHHRNEGNLTTGAGSALLEMIYGVQAPTRITGESVTKISRAAAGLLAAWEPVPPTNFMGCPFLDVYVVHGFLGPIECNHLRKLFDGIKPDSALRSGGNRATDCTLQLITHRITTLILDLQRVFRHPCDSLDVVQLANHNVVVRSATGRVLLTESSVAFHPAPLDDNPDDDSSTFRLCATFFLDFRAPACITLPPSSGLL